MSKAEGSITHAAIVETEVQFSLPELSRVCGVEMTLLESLVQEGVLTPLGDSPAQWRFEGSVLPRARTAARLVKDLELSAPGAALVLDLCDEIEALKAQLRRVQGSLA
jgi:chaperone modulatory protein CbpM